MRDIKGISTEHLEEDIEALMAEINPGKNNGSRSFGVNCEAWADLMERVTEYIRLRRNVRRATPDQMKITPTNQPVEKEAA